MKKIIVLLILYTLFELKVYSQNDVELTVTGIGTDAENSRNNALRNAIEQAYGAFLSSNTLIKNDELVKDEIISLSNGNIKKFDILSQFKMPDANWSTSIKCIVSVNKLDSYCKSKGMETTFNGNLFSFNAEYKELSIKNERKLIEELVNIVKLTCSNLYDYSLEIDGEPLNDGHSYYKWPGQINIYMNDNYQNIYNLILNSLKNISLPKSQIEEYKKYNFPIYTLEIYTQKQPVAFGNFEIKDRQFGGEESYIGWCKLYNLNWNSKTKMKSSMMLRLKKGGSADFEGFRKKYFYDLNYNFKNLNSSQLFFRNDISEKLKDISTYISYSIYNFDVKINDEIIFQGLTDFLYSSSDKEEFSYLLLPFFSLYNKEFTCLSLDEVNKNRGRDISGKKYQDGTKTILGIGFRDPLKYFQNPNLPIDNNSFVLNNIKTNSHIGFTAVVFSLSLADFKKAKVFSVAPNGKSIAFDYRGISYIENKTDDKNQQYKFVKIEKGQSLLTIAKIYKISVEKLMSINPELKDGIKVGQIIKIP